MPSYPCSPSSRTGTRSCSGAASARFNAEASYTRPTDPFSHGALPNPRAKISVIKSFEHQNWWVSSSNGDGITELSQQHCVHTTKSFLIGIGSFNSYPWNASFNQLVPATKNGKPPKHIKVLCTNCNALHYTQYSCWLHVAFCKIPPPRQL